jgi:hypothetical protein
MRNQKKNEEKIIWKRFDKSEVRDYTCVNLFFSYYIMNVLFELFEELSESFSSLESKESKEKWPWLAIQKMIDTIFRVRTKDNLKWKLIQNWSIVVPIEGWSNYGGTSNAYELTIEQKPENWVESRFRITNSDRNDRFGLTIEYTKFNDGSFNVKIDSSDMKKRQYFNAETMFDSRWNESWSWIFSWAITEWLVPISPDNLWKWKVKNYTNWRVEKEYSWIDAMKYILSAFERKIDTRLEKKNQ